MARAAFWPKSGKYRGEDTTSHKKEGHQQANNTPLVASKK